MLEALQNFKKELPLLLKDEAGWNSLYVDYSAPIVERLWREWNGYRIFLHKIHPCEYNQSLYHKHNWPSAMEIVYGKYEMGIGYGVSNTPPPIASRIILPMGSSYEMTEKNGWHYVRPLDTCAYSIMITGKPWGSGAPKSERPLRTLTAEESQKLFSFFRAAF